MASKKTHLEFIDEMRLKHPNLKVLGEYINSQTKIIVEDNLGIKYLTKPNDLSSLHPPTIQTAINKTDAFIIKLRLIQPKLIVLGEYINSQAKILVQDELGIHYNILPNDLLQNVTPSIQSAVDKNQAFKKMAQNIHNSLYDYSLVHYDKRGAKVNIKCNHCKLIFSQRPDKHLQGDGCPICNSSKGEIKIQNLLEELNIDFKKNKTFKKCKYKSLLKFDFYLPDYNTCIEYDGRQHFETVEAWGGKLNLQEIQKRDEIKNNFCLNNQISLLRIKYTNLKETENIIRDYLNQQIV